MAHPGYGGYGGVSKELVRYSLVHTKSKSQWLAQIATNGSHLIGTFCILHLGPTDFVTENVFARYKAFISSLSITSKFRYLSI